MGSRIASAGLRVSCRSSLREDDNTRSSKSFTFTSLATSSTSRSHAAMLSSRALSLRVWRYATSYAFQTELQVSGEDTPKKFRSASASERPVGRENFRRFISPRGKFRTQAVHCEEAASSRRLASASSNCRCKFSQKCAGRWRTLSKARAVGGVIGALPLQISLIVFGVRPERRARSRCDHPLKSRYSITVSPGWGTAFHSNLVCRALSMSVLDCDNGNRLNRLPIPLLIQRVQFWRIFSGLEQHAVRMFQINRKRPCMVSFQFMTPFGPRFRGPKVSQ